MINHARTLLRNTISVPGAPGEEYVPPDFVPVRLPPLLQSMQRSLFGAKPDSVFRNFRLQQYMMMLHSTELAEFVFDLDSRVTYMPDWPTIFFDEATFVPTVYQTTAHETMGIYLQGGVRQVVATGQVYEAWKLKMLAPHVVSAQRIDQPASKPQPITLTVTNGLSNFFPLPGSGLSVAISGLSGEVMPAPTGIPFRLFGKIDSQINSFDRAMFMTPPFSKDVHGNTSVLLPNVFRLFGKLDKELNAYDRAMYLTPPYAKDNRDLSNVVVPTPSEFRLFGKVDTQVNSFERAALLTPPYAKYIGPRTTPPPPPINVAGSSWQIEAIARPTNDLQIILSNLSQVMTEGLSLQLFGANPAEPFKTFKNLWEQNSQMPYKLGGLLMALIYRTNLLRK